MTIQVDQALVEQCFMHFYGLDVSNAAMHCAAVRFSPVTFRLQEALDDRDATGLSSVTRSEMSPSGVHVGTAWQHVHNHNGAYEEDKGR
jgi:hypothetical protein